MGKIVFKRDTLKSDEEIVLTADIADKNRQQLAYNVILQMVENGAEITVDDEVIPITMDDLYLSSEGPSKDEHGLTETRYEKPYQDPEWYGANKDELSDIRKMMDEYKATRDELNLLYGAKDTGKITVQAMTQDEEGTVNIVKTASYEKANEALNFLYMGVDGSVTISFPTENGMQPVVANGEAVSVILWDDKEFVRTKHIVNDWTTGKAPDIELGFVGERNGDGLEDDFADAVAAIPTDENGLEQ